jgi:hypothetical protein
MMNFYFIGVKGVQVEELWSLDAEQFENLKYVCFSVHLCFIRLLNLEGLIIFSYLLYHISLSLCRPIHGLIFLFKWVQDDEHTGSIVQDTRLDKIFFAKQVKTLDLFFLTNSMDQNSVLEKQIVTQSNPLLSTEHEDSFSYIQFRKLPSHITSNLINI